MKYRIVYSQLAIKDLEQVMDEVFHASKSIDVTNKCIEDLMDKVDSKADYPNSGTPLFYEDLFTGYYYIVFKAYLVFYRIDKDKMLVDRVLYGKRDYMKLLRK